MCIRCWLCTNPCAGGDENVNYMQSLPLMDWTEAGREWHPDKKMRYRLDEANPSCVEQLLIMPSDISSVNWAAVWTVTVEPGLGKLSSNPAHFSRYFPGTTWCFCGYEGEYSVSGRDKAETKGWTSGRHRVGQGPQERCNEYMLSACGRKCS